jgi:hypothetical protein
MDGAGKMFLFVLCMWQYLNELGTFGDETTYVLASDCDWHDQPPDMMSLGSLPIREVAAAAVGGAAPDEHYATVNDTTAVGASDFHAPILP